MKSIIRPSMIRLISHRLVCGVLSLSLCITSLGVNYAKASPISTGDFLSYSESSKKKDQLVALLDREDVISALIKYDVSPLEARQRLDALTDQEISHIASVMDELPAGSGVGTVIGAVVFVFLVLLVTDILGFTKIYPFTRTIR